MSTLESTSTATKATCLLGNLTSMAGETVQPMEVHVDRPFFFAIQHRISGARLFLGHVIDPR